MGTLRVGQTVDINDVWLNVEKIISYTSYSEFTYYYPRIILTEEQADLKIEFMKVDYDLDYIVALFNHLIEVLCISYKEFVDLFGYDTTHQLKLQCKLVDLIYSTFQEDFVLYIKPLLNLGVTYLQVEESFDKFYIISKYHGKAYRIDPLNRIKSFDIKTFDLTTITFQEETTPKSRTITEKIVTVVSTKIYSWLK